VNRVVLCILLAAGVLAAIVFGSDGWANTQGDRVFYVNFEQGDDSRSGLGADQAWQHAPGDPAATGTAAGMRLLPGDRVVFAPGVTYRGAIEVKAAGTAEKPIIFEGGQGGAAVIDGSDPVEVRPCPSAEACGGAANWQQLVLIGATRPAEGEMALFTTSGPLRPAQDPDPSSDFYRHEPPDMAEADGRQLERGQVSLPRDMRARVSPGASLALWVRPNLVQERPITGVDGNNALFDPAGLEFYKDRPSRVAIVNSIGALDRPGEYVVLPGNAGVVAMLPQGASTVSLGSGRGGFNLGGASFVTIRNLTFANMADGGKIFGGIAVFSNMRRNQGITVEGSRFLHSVMSKGQGPITLRGVNDIAIRDNLIEGVALGSGMRISGPSSDVRITGNTVRRVGRTGIMLMGVDGGLVTRNLVEDVRGVHGNGVSAYLANHNVRFVENIVRDAVRPVTFHGAGDDQAQDNALSFERNILIASEGATASLTSWGRSTRDVRIVGNVLLGGRFGLQMNASDRNVVIDHNFGLAPSFPRGKSGDWRMGDNRWTTPGQRVQRAWGATGDAGTAGELSDMKAFLCANGTGQPGGGEPMRIGTEVMC